MAQGEPEVSIVIPIYNEEVILEGRAEDLLSSLESEKIDFEMLLCENGSTDKTREIAQQLEQKYSRVHLITLDRPNYGKAMKAGFVSSKGKYVFNFDIDYYNVDFLRRALDSLEDYDIVIGSKVARGSIDVRSPLRKLITRGFNLILKLLFGLKANDTHGIKGFTRNRISKVVEQTMSGKDLFDTELIIRAERKNLRIAELPVVIEEKRSARSNILKRIPRTMVGVLSLRLKLWKEMF